MFSPLDWNDKLRQTSENNHWVEKCVLGGTWSDLSLGLPERIFRILPEEWHSEKSFICQEKHALGRKKKVHSWKVMLNNFRLQIRVEVVNSEFASLWWHLKKLSWSNQKCEIREYKLKNDKSLCGCHNSWVMWTLVCWSLELKRFLTFEMK